MHVPRPFRLAAGAALDLVAPPRCLACEDDGPRRVGLCRACAVLLRPLPPEPCPVCAGRLGPGADPADCRSCAALRPRFVATRAAVLYAGLGGELVRRAKYGRDPLFALPLVARLLDATVDWASDARPQVVVPVPSTLRRRRERGFNLAEVLAEPLARSLRVPFRRRVLRRIGEPVPQAALTRAERRRAAAGTVGAVGVPPLLRFLGGSGTGIEGRTVLLVDDVLTTGATANASARALIDAGARRVLVAVAARA